MAVNSCWGPSMRQSVCASSKRTVWAQELRPKEVKLLSHPNQKAIKGNPIHNANMIFKLQCHGYALGYWETESHMLCLLTVMLSQFWMHASILLRHPLCFSITIIWPIFPGCKAQQILDKSTQNYFQGQQVNTCPKNYLLSLFLHVWGTEQVCALSLQETWALK